MPKNNPIFDITVKTFQGLEAIVVEELKQLGVKQINQGKRSVDFKGDTKLLYKANLHLRTATRVLVPIFKFKAYNENFYQKKIQEVDWSKYITAKDSYYIDTNVMSKFLKNPPALTERLKRSVGEHFKKKGKPQPTLKTHQPDLRINLHVFNDMVNISLDSSGDYLFKRAYWAEKPESYLNEVLAAGLILLSGWDKKSPLIDPMCGSASLLFEAALIANNIAPNIYTPTFGFMKWKDFDKSLWEEVVAEAKNAEKPGIVKIRGYESSPSDIKMAKMNLRHANLIGKIDFEVCDFFDLKTPAGKSFLVFEPPATERIGKIDINSFYRKMGEHLRENFDGSTVCVLCPDHIALQNMNLKASFRKNFLNGKVESFFEKYVIPQKKANDEGF